MTETRVRLALPSDRDQLTRLRGALWPESLNEEDRQELTLVLAGKPNSTMPLVILVAEAMHRLLVGFLEIGLRSHADGCDTRLPVGFVEGWFVLESYRRKRVGAQFLAAAENWARCQGSVELASDTWFDNDVSQRVHEALGF